MNAPRFPQSSHALHFWSSPGRLQKGERYVDLDFFFYSIPDVAYAEHIAALHGDKDRDEDDLFGQQRGAIARRDAIGTDAKQFRSLRVTATMPVPVPMRGAIPALESPHPYLDPSNLIDINELSLGIDEHSSGPHVDPRLLEDWILRASEKVRLQLHRRWELRRWLRSDLSRDISQRQREHANARLQQIGCRLRRAEAEYRALVDALADALAS
ncbi:hypothetical protein C8R43DRAFT_960056 [Mycena crocata]|nr:hypothetical protein C8R43DRAFT_960056 [Mycena crocata]